MGIDPVGFDPNNIHSFNRYAYGNNNPYRYIDPNGMWAEDIVLAVPGLVMGAHSLGSNLSSGNFTGGLVDALGMVADGVALAVPGVPGGAGLAIAATRKVEAEGVKTFYHYTDAAGAKAIAETGMIKADAKGRVHITDQKLDPATVKDRLFIGNSGEKGSHVVELQMKQGANLRAGKNSNETIHQGTIKDGRQADLKIGQNGF